MISFLFSLFESQIYYGKRKVNPSKYKVYKCKKRFNLSNNNLRGPISPIRRPQQRKRRDPRIMT